MCFCAGRPGLVWSGFSVRAEISLKTELNSEGPIPNGTRINSPATPQPP